MGAGPAPRGGSAPRGIGAHGNFRSLFFFSLFSFFILPEKPSVLVGVSFPYPPHALFFFSSFLFFALLRLQDGAEGDAGLGYVAAEMFASVAGEWPALPEVLGKHFPAGRNVSTVSPT